LNETYREIYFISGNVAFFGLLKHMTVKIHGWSYCKSSTALPYTFQYRKILSLSCTANEMATG